MSKGLKKRRLVLALSACMMAASSVVYALGMGEIEVNTSLNEPLDAKIKLFSATPDELKNLKVEMASSEAFSRMGIDRLPVLSDLNFELVSKGAGAPYIKVSSPKAVKEPFLDFILTVNWASGQMMREYTLLLDPPVFERDQRVGQVSAATTQPAQVVREEPAPASAQPQPRVAPPGSYGPTARTDTLWSVAQDMRPEKSVSVPQMMIALLKKNPEAFDNNNINNLKAGYILRQPEMEVITQLSKRDAAAESNSQYQEWLASKGQAPAPVSGQQQRVAAAASGEPVGKPAPAPAVAPKEQSEARLQLLSPDEEARIRAGVGSGATGEAAESLRRELAVAMENAEATRQENADLRSRLDELEKQLQSVQKLLTLKDDTLGALQANAQGDQQQAVPPPMPTTDQETTAQAEKPAAAAKPAAKPAVQPEPVEPSFLDDVLNNPIYMYAAGGGLVVLLLIAMMMRRRRLAEEEDFTLMAPVSEAVKAKPPAQEKVAAAAAATAATVAAAAMQEKEEEDVAAGDFDAGIGAIHTEESEIDPVAEADVYLAYRRYEQAEALLKEAISVDPERHELKLKLLEIYHATKDKDSFEAQAESLYAALGGQNEELWSQAVQMGRELLPDHPLFSEGSGTSSTDDFSADDTRLDFESSDVDTGGDEEFDLDAQRSHAEEDADLSDVDLAESLSFPELGDVETARDFQDEKLAKVDDSDTSLDDLGDLDFDLDLGSDDELGIGAEEGKDEIAFELNEELADSLESDELETGAGLEDLSADEVVEEEVLTDDLGDQEHGLESLDELPDSGIENSEHVKQKQELSLSDSDEHLDGGENPYANADLDSFSTGESDSWNVEAAQSVFHSRDVEGETDGLLDSARKKEEELNQIEFDETPSNVDADSAEELEAGADQEDITATMDEQTVDSMADIANLGEMDFSELSDEDNDDIFDSTDDIVGTKLDLAKAYIDMGDQDGARSILDEVVEEGDDDQRQQAEQLKRQIS